MFLVQLSISLVGEKPAKLHVATFGMADWKLKPSHVLADCSCRLNSHSTHSSRTTVCLLKDKKQGYNLLNGKSVNSDKHESIYTVIVVFISFIHTHTHQSPRVPGHVMLSLSFIAIMLYVGSEYSINSRVRIISCFCLFIYFFVR